MIQADIDRINFLARKAKAEGLTAEELAEQKQLRASYIAEWRKGLEQTLDNTYIMDSQGNKTKIGPKS